METKDYKGLATCAKWFVAWATLGGFFFLLIAAISVVISIVRSFHSGVTDSPAPILATVGVALMGAFQLWCASITKQHRPLGAQIHLYIAVLGTTASVAKLFAFPAQVPTRIVGLTINALLIWWFYRTVQSLSSVPSKQETAEIPTA
jgi:hypothetical protein